jgi:hypothetical protein
MLWNLLPTLSIVVLTLGGLSVRSQAKAPPTYRQGSLAKQKPQPIYSSNPNDPWNRIFYLLFTRTVKLRLADNFRAAAPLISVSPFFVPHWASTRIFERIESGDRAIDPLYPSFFSAAGAESVLEDPRFVRLKRALQVALDERAARSPLERALMQSDAWAAFDVLDQDYGFSGKLLDRRNELLTLLARFVRKLALTPTEIARLPDNYAAAQQSRRLPSVFDGRSGWVELEWFPNREHDSSADDRRASRVFLKPRGGTQQFFQDLNDSLRQNPNSFVPDVTNLVDGAALVTEDLLIDSTCRVEPSPLTFDVETRSFARNAQGRVSETKIAEYELSRKLLLANTLSGGLFRVGPGDPVYLPAAGNDYTFASPSPGGPEPRLPILGSLRGRCEACHLSTERFMTFSIVRPPHERSPAVRQLVPSEDPRGHYVAQQKMKQADFIALCGRQ